MSTPAQKKVDEALDLKNKYEDAPRDSKKKEKLKKELDAFMKKTFRSEKGLGVGFMKNRKGEWLIGVIRKLGNKPPFLTMGEPSAYVKESAFGKKTIKVKKADLKEKDKPKKTIKKKIKIDDGKGVGQLPPKKSRTKIGLKPEGQRVEIGEINKGKVVKAPKIKKEDEVRPKEEVPRMAKKPTRAELNFKTFENLQKMIMMDRPNIKESTIKQYMKHIKYILNQDADNFDLFLNPDEVKQKMKGLKPLRQRDIISAVVVAVKAMTKNYHFLSEYENCRDNINLLYFKSNPKKYEKEIKFWEARKDKRKNKKDFCKPTSLELKNKKNETKKSQNIKPTINKMATEIKKSKGENPFDNPKINDLWDKAVEIQKENKVKKKFYKASLEEFLNKKSYEGITKNEIKDLIEEYFLI